MYEFEKEGNTITFPDSFEQDFRDRKFTTDQFCDMLLKYHSDHKDEFDAGNCVKIDLSLYKGGKNSKWLDKASVYEFVDVLVNKLKGWSFSLSKENLIGVFTQGDKFGYGIKNDKHLKLWIFSVRNN